MVSQYIKSEKHVPVLLDYCTKLLAPAFNENSSKNTKIFIDATLGMGGHSFALLNKMPNIKLIGIDRDQQALEIAEKKLAPFKNRITLVHSAYDRIPEILEELNVTNVNAILFDLGVSSMQLDEPERGFAYSYDSPLDMRMDANLKKTAADIVNLYSEKKIVFLLKEWGEERFAKSIAANIVKTRNIKPYTTTGELVNTIRNCVPSYKNDAGHPAKRTFQAIRIEVNEEINILKKALPAAIKSLSIHGRIAVLSYHSLEDRLVKQIFSAGAKNTTPLGLPVEVASQNAYLKLLTKGAYRSSEQENLENPRAKSVKLRCAEKILKGNV